MCVFFNDYCGFRRYVRSSWILMFYWIVGCHSRFPFRISDSIPFFKVYSVSHVVHIENVHLYFCFTKIRKIHFWSKTFWFYLQKYYATRNTSNVTECSISLFKVASVALEKTRCTVSLFAIQLHTILIDVRTNCLFCALPAASLCTRNTRKLLPLL